MKKKRYISFVLMTSMFFLGACSDWFDVSPKTDLKAKDLFETQSGFENSLAGIYILMTQDAVYGGDLSFGLIEQLVQSYDMVPNQSQPSNIYTYDVNTNGYQTKRRLAETWKKGYNIIANVNNLLKWLDKNGERVIASEEKRNMIRGEALAIRAYVHFDLLRGWGPVYRSKPDAPSIPYRVVADGSKQPLLPASEIIRKILADLEQAKKYLSFEKDVALSGADIDLRFRFNYHAVNALMARIYCYVNDSQNAIGSAKDVIAHCGLELQVGNREDPVLFSETICGVYMYKMQETLSDNFSEGPKFSNHYYATIRTINDFFGISGSETEDIRAKSSAFIRYNDQDKAISRKYIKNDNGVIPLIRLPEMYYILCEMSSLKEAASYLNTVRNRRGYSTSTNLSFQNETDRLQALNSEYRKEFYAEGQYFYFLKRHEFSTFSNCPLGNMGEEQYVFPLPDAEKEYGWASDDNKGGK